MASTSTVAADIQLRLVQKIRDFCDGIDPFTITDSRDPLPQNVSYLDVYHYCIERDSAYTYASFKAYKTLEAYQYYEGWVQSIICKQITGGYILLTKVKHSFRLSLKPVQCFVSVDKKGVILTGYCECMAGLGEVCRHIGAILFVLHAWGEETSEIHNSESISCTEVLSKWLVPKMKKIDMASVDNICFDSAKKATKSGEYESVDTIDMSANVSSFFSDHDEILHEDEEAETVNAEVIDRDIDNFLQKNRDKGVSCPMMALQEPFASTFVPKKQETFILDLTADACEEDLSIIKLFLASLYEPAYVSLTLDELQYIGESIELAYTQDEIDFIEERTREQSSCKLWYRFRTGRVTGSVFKSGVEHQLQHLP